MPTENHCFLPFVEDTELASARAANMLLRSGRHFFPALCRDEPETHGGPKGRSKNEETISVSNDFEATAIPNPTTGITRFEFSAAFTGTIHLTSITGRSVRTFTAEETHKLSIDLSGIAPGLYLYLVSDEQGRSVYLGKIVIQ